MSKLASASMQQINLQIRKGLLVNGRSGDGLLQGGRAEGETGSTWRLARAALAGRLKPHKHKFCRRSPTGAGDKPSRELTNQRVGACHFWSLVHANGPRSQWRGPRNCTDPARSKQVQASSPADNRAGQKARKLRSSPGPVRSRSTQARIQHSSSLLIS